MSHLRIRSSRATLGWSEGPWPTEGRLRVPFSGPKPAEGSALSELRSERVRASGWHRRRARTHALRIPRVIRVFVLIRRKVFIATAGCIAACACSLCAITARIVLGVQGGLVDVNNYTLFLICCLRSVHRSSIYTPEKVLLTRPRRPPQHIQRLRSPSLPWRAKHR